MFIILLTYIKIVAEVDRHLAAHRAWVNQGFDDGFLLAAVLSRSSGHVQSNPC